MDVTLNPETHTKITKAKGSWVRTGTKCGGVKHVLWDANPPIPLFNVE